MDNISQVSTLELNKISSTCAGLNFRKVSRVVTQHFDEILRPSGLLITQFTVLVALAKVRAIAITKLAEILMMDRTTLTRNLKPMQREGWLEIEPGQDKRTRIVSMSPDGEIALAKALPLWQQAQMNVVELLGEARWDVLLSQLTEITELHRER
ncbi:family transcriptional regulator [Leptolyngbya sp. Heron Island J]|uniref:MarR family winged helix-turn-helix transcriptional regulator n=1 Tax=Leptolyngbya sp. Heron Island J TaxID=1385935 RepID=UPI0003B9B796|nr:MarR family transcriptional regulator [Leptolyngbya sp. Heron Island J]ESA36365.1 family transcriptional regulator [Leptolyngbya sp. Heron Island J]